MTEQKDLDKEWLLLIEWVTAHILENGQETVPGEPAHHYRTGLKILKTLISNYISDYERMD